jgi:threonine synthase
MQTFLRCIGCDHTTDLLAERKFLCPRCSNLYDVVHDLSSLGHTFTDFTRIFDERAMISGRHSLSPLTQSGVWRFKEWVMPYLSNNHIITLREGNVPIVPAGKNLCEWIGGDVDLWLILEGMTPTGSFKDFGGTVMISVAKAAGITHIGCASTGDTSAMAAAYASAAGMGCVVILPQGKVTPAQLAQPLVHGAKVITLPGDFDICMKVVRELVEAGALFPANSLNPTRIEGHQATVFLTAQFFDWNLPNWFALPVGNGSNCSSVGKGIRLMQSLGYSGTMPRILGCQSMAARPLAASWLEAARGTVTIDSWRSEYRPMQVGETTATAARIGDPVSREKVMREILSSNGAMVIADEAALNEAVSVCGRDGYFVCPQTGTALEGVRRAVKDGTIAEGSRVVVVSTANGLKFTESASANLLGNIIKAPDCKLSTVANILNL